jgi:hypothetical protein
VWPGQERLSTQLYPGETGRYLHRVGQQHLPGDEPTNPAAGVVIGSGLRSVRGPITATASCRDKYWRLPVYYGRPVEDRTVWRRVNLMSRLYIGYGGVVPK